MILTAFIPHTEDPVIEIDAPSPVVQVTADEARDLAAHLIELADQLESTCDAAFCTSHPVSSGLCAHHDDPLSAPLTRSL